MSNRKMTVLATMLALFLLSAVGSILGQAAPPLRGSYSPNIHPRQILDVDYSLTQILPVKKDMSLLAQAGFSWLWAVASDRQQWSRGEPFNSGALCR
jgi:hypothetical protein